MTEQEGAAMTPDIVTEARRFLGAWGDDVYPSQLATQLVAEVERLLTALDQRTDLLAALARVVWLVDNNPNAVAFDRDDVTAAIGDQLAAARLLGGDQ